MKEDNDREGDEEYGKQLIVETKTLARELRIIARDHKKLSQIKGNDELIHRIKEVFLEIEEQSDKLIATCSQSKSVQRSFKALLSSLHEIEEFFEAVNTTWMFMNKNRMRLKMQNHYQTLRARCTQLMTAVSLELLTSAQEPPPQRTISELYLAGIHYYYAVGGKAKNYTLAFEKFNEAAERDDPDGMYMTGKCYLEGKGIDANETLAMQYLYRAAGTGYCPHSKTEIALHILKKLKQAHPSIIKEYFGHQASINNNNNNHASNNYNNSKLMTRGDVSNSQNSHSQNSKWNKLKQHVQTDTSMGSELDTVDHHHNNTNTHNNTNSNRNSMTASTADLDMLEIHDQLFADLQVAIRLLLEASSEGHASAKTQLGMIYEEVKDYSQAAKWYSLASNGGCSEGTYHLAALLFHGKGGSFGSRHKALSLFLIALKHGQPDAYHGVGMCYELGLGVETSTAMALYYYRKGSELNSTISMYHYGYLAVQQAIELQDHLATILQNSSTNHHEYNVPIINNITNITNKFIYNTHGSNIPLNVNELSPEEAYQAGYIYDNELSKYIHLEQRIQYLFRDGIHYLRIAAGNNVVDASFQLGRLYNQGIGVVKDVSAALENYIAAASLQHDRAAYLAANLYYDMNYLKSAAYYYHIAARAGTIPEAMNALALLLEDGRVTLDKITSITYIHNDTTATPRNTDRGSGQGTGDVHLAAMWYFEACCKHYAPAFLNLALLLATDEIYSFPTLLAYYHDNNDVNIDNENNTSTNYHLDTSNHTLTLPEAIQYLENNIPVEISHDEEKATSFMNLLQSLTEKSRKLYNQQKYLNNQQSNKAPTSANAPVTASSMNELHHTNARINQRLSNQRESNSNNNNNNKEDIGALVLMDQGNMDMNNGFAGSHQLHYISNSAYQQNQTYHTNPTIHVDENTAMHCYPNVTDSPFINPYQKNKKVNFQVNNPHPTLNNSMDSTSNKQLYVTNGPIPPPSYVPKAIMQSIPTSISTKPSPPKTTTSNAPTNQMFHNNSNNGQSNSLQMSQTNYQPSSHYTNKTLNNSVDVPNSQVPVLDHHPTTTSPSNSYNYNNNNYQLYTNPNTNTNTNNNSLNDNRLVPTVNSSPSPILYHHNSNNSSKNNNTNNNSNNNNRKSLSALDRWKVLQHNKQGAQNPSVGIAHSSVNNSGDYDNYLSSSVNQLPPRSKTAPGQGLAQGQGLGQGMNLQRMDSQQSIASSTETSLDNGQTQGQHYQGHQGRRSSPMNTPSGHRARSLSPASVRGNTNTNTNPTTTASSGTFSTGFAAFFGRKRSNSASAAPIPAPTLNPSSLTNDTNTINTATNVADTTNNNINDINNNNNNINNNIMRTTSNNTLLSSPSSPANETVQSNQSHGNNANNDPQNNIVMDNKKKVSTFSKMIGMFGGAKKKLATPTQDIDDSPTHTDNNMNNDMQNTSLDNASELSHDTN